jgi:flagellar export protein FliJ
MSFRFSLEGLRKLRLSEEHQQELLLQKASQLVSGLERQIAGIEVQLRSAWVEEQRKLENRVTGSELQFDLLCRSLLKRREGGLQKELLTALALRDQQREAFREAHRRREILDSLRARKLEIFRLQETRRDQQRADEEFLLRASFSR